MKINLRIKIGVVFVLIGLLMLSFTKLPNDIKGWFLAGSSPGSYTIGVVKDAQRNGNVGYIKSKNTEITVQEFGTIMQQFTPKDYLGKKVKLTGYLKSANVKAWAGMWMRVDGNDKKVLSFDNMQDRPIRGTTDWTKYEIILNVPKESKLLAYGVLLSGNGSVWLDDFKFEILQSDEEPTGSGVSFKLDKPTNTGFEENN